MQVVVDLKREYVKARQKRLGLCRSFITLFWYVMDNYVVKRYPSLESVQYALACACMVAIAVAGAVGFNILQKAVQDMNTPCRIMELYAVAEDGGITEFITCRTEDGTAYHFTGEEVNDPYMYKLLTVRVDRQGRVTGVQ